MILRCPVCHKKTALKEMCGSLTDFPSGYIARTVKCKCGHVYNANFAIVPVGVTAMIVDDLVDSQDMIRKTDKSKIWEKGIIK